MYGMRERSNLLHRGQLPPKQVHLQLGGLLHGYRLQRVVIFLIPVQPGISSMTHYRDSEAFGNRFFTTAPPAAHARHRQAPMCGAGVGLPGGRVMPRRGSPRSGRRHAREFRNVGGSTAGFRAHVPAARAICPKVQRARRHQDRIWHRERGSDIPPATRMGARSGLRRDRAER